MLLVMLSGIKALAYDGLLTGEGSNISPYYIMDDDDWETFTSWLNTEETAPYYRGSHYRLGADISVTTWAATLSEYPFCGTFDGNGHKITITFEQTEDKGVALFQYVGNGCEIHDLTIYGTISTDYKFAGSFVSEIKAGEFESINVVNISRCRSLVTFNLGISGDATSGGLVAFSRDYVCLTINDCLFGGSYTTSTATHLSGFVGYQSSYGYTYIENCYVNPLSLNIPQNDNNRNLCRYGNPDSFKNSNCYYSVSASNFADDQGEYATPNHSAQSVADKLGYWTVTDGKPVPKTLNMMVPNCTLFKGFTVSSYFSRYNTNDNNGDQGAAKLVDDDRSTSWRVSYPYSIHQSWEPVCVEFYTDKKFIPKGYILTTGNDTKEHPDHRPKKWQISAYQYSNSSDGDILDTRDASNSRQKLPESDMTDKVYFFPDFESITTGYQKFSFMVTELWREDRVWNEINHEWNVNGADFVCELGEIQIFGVMVDEEVHNMENCVISGIQSCYEYTGDVIPLNYLVTNYYNTRLIEDTDYTKTMVRKHGTYTYNNVEEVSEEGEYTITFTGTDDYDGTKSYSFVVTDPDIPMPLVLTNDNGSTYYYVKMPKTGQTTLDLTSTDPEFTQQFKVFSDNGHNLPYSTNCNGKLLITAPIGYALQVQGTISCKGYPDDYLVMYDGDNDTYNVLGDEHYGVYGTQDIPLLYTTGQFLLLDFKSNGVQSGFTGVNLTVTLVSPIDYHDITIAEDNHGALTPTGEITEVIFSTPVTLNVVPDEGYMLQDVSVETDNGTEVMTDKGLWYTGENTVTFNMPASDVEVTPTFAAKNDLSMNMPAHSADLAHATNAIIPAGVTTFKIYDDGGPGGNYSSYCNGMLLLTAPDNTVLEISGTISVYDYDDSYLAIYDGDNFNNPIECYYDDTDINKVLSTGNQVLLVFVTYETPSSGLDLTVKVIDEDETFDIAIDNDTGANVTIDEETTATAKVFDEVTLDVTTTSGYVVTDYIMEPDCNSPISGGVWHESPDEATFVMPAEDIEITPTITNTLTAAGGLYINMPTSNRNNPKRVDIPSGVTSFKVYDDGGEDGSYSMYCDGYLVLKAPSNYRLKLTGTVRCNNEGALHDYLKVYDGDTEHLTPIGKAAGYGNSSGEDVGTLISSGRTMVLNFSSAGNSMSGLDLTVEVTNEAIPYVINFDNTQVPVGCSIGITGYNSQLDTDEYVANVGRTITVSVTHDEDHLLNSIAVTDNNGNDVALSQGMCWYNGNNTSATFIMPASTLTITYEFVELGEQYIKLPKQNGIDSKFEVTPAEGITSFKIYDDGGSTGNYSNNCDSYTLLTAPEDKVWQLTGTVTTENINDYLIPYEGNTITRGIDGTSYGKPLGENIGTLISIHNEVLLEFQSNGSVIGAGLNLTASIVNPITRLVDGYVTLPFGQMGWAFIAAPMQYDVSPNFVENIFPYTSDEYDLYRFNQSADAEWENYKGHYNNFSIEGGVGYLYAVKYPRTMQFGGSVCAEDSKEVPLVYDATAGLAGWNLVGNPLLTAAYVNRPYYRMDEFGSSLEVIDDYSNNQIPVCTGVIVCAEDENDAVTFSKNKPSPPESKGSVNMKLSKVGARGSETVQDNAIVSFNQGTRLGKYIFNKDNARIYIPEDGSDYAIVYSNHEGEVPVNFKTKTSGKYTITVEPRQGATLQGVQLVDKFEDVTVNLNAVPYYTFVGSAADSPDRFMLVFSPDSGTDSFVYQNGSDIIVVGEGELQVFDVLGRMVDTMDVNGVETLHETSLRTGVYIFRLNGKTQKIVVK